MTNPADYTFEKLLTLVDITEAIWIDDCFASEKDEELYRRIRSKVKELTVGKHIPNHDLLTDINFSAPDIIWEKQLETALFENNERLREILDSLISQIRELEGKISQDEGDLTLAQVNFIKNSFDDIKTFSCKNWMEEKAIILDSCTKRTLFLIDRQFTDEGFESDTGDQILLDVLNTAPDSYCIMYTHTVGKDETEALRQVVADSIKVKTHKFAIMSKRGLGASSTGLELPLINAFRTTFVHRFCHALFRKIAEIMKTSLDSAVENLVSLSIQEIDVAIFENSIEEGASELDVVTRILALQQRVEAEKYFTNSSNIYRRLQMLRSVRKFGDQEHFTPNLSTQESRLHKWRLREVLDPPDLINSIHSPLSCGDLFENTSNGRKYALLAQPCDLTVRKNGGRNTEEGFFILLTEETSSFEYMTKYFIIEGMSGSNSTWIFDFSESAIVNLKVLDLSIFNKDGSVTWTKGQQSPSELLPGWEKRFDKTKRKIEPNLENLPTRRRFLSLNKRIKNFEATVLNGDVTFPYKRIGRLRTPYSEAVLGSLMAFQARSAFDHDFAKSLRSNNVSN